MEKCKKCGDWVSQFDDEHPCNQKSSGSFLDSAIIGAVTGSALLGGLLGGDLLGGVTGDLLDGDLMD